MNMDRVRAEVESELARVATFALPPSKPAPRFADQPKRQGRAGGYIAPCCYELVHSWALGLKDLRVQGVWLGSGAPTLFCASGRWGF
jgi:hypothetical protein